MARTRFVRILLIPLLAPLFLIGWLLAFSGEEKADAKKSRQKASAQSKQEVYEIGVLPEVTAGESMEVPLKAEDSD